MRLVKGWFIYMDLEHFRLIVNTIMTPQLGYISNAVWSHKRKHNDHLFIVLLHPSHIWGNIMMVPTCDSAHSCWLYSATHLEIMPLDNSFFKGFCSCICIMIYADLWQCTSHGDFITLPHGEIRLPAPWLDVLLSHIIFTLLKPVLTKSYYCRASS